MTYTDIEETLLDIHRDIEETFQNGDIPFLKTRMHVMHVDYRRRCFILKMTHARCLGVRLIF